MAGRTTFVVSGRLSLLRRADLILVLENGRLTQSGTHDELVHRPGPYHETALLQIMDFMSARTRITEHPPSQIADTGASFDAREAITYYNPMEEREADKAPLQWPLIRRIFTYTRPYAAKRNWLFVLTFTRGLQLPALAWMIGRTINGPISRPRFARHLLVCRGIFCPGAVHRSSTFHFRQRFALELGEAVVHDMRSELFAKLMTHADVVFQPDQVRPHHQPDDLGHRQRARWRAGRGVRAGRAGVADDRLGGADGVVRLETVFPDGAARAGHLVREQTLSARNDAGACAKCRNPGAAWPPPSRNPSSGIRVTQAFVRQEVNAGFFRKLVDVHGENNVGVAQASAVFVPLLQLKSQLFLGAMALLGAFGALRWHGWLHMEVGDLVMFFFLANLFFDPVQVIGNQ